MQKHFVTFYSPGTFFPEESTLPINKWDVKKAMKMAHSVSERYDATPYGFTFSTRVRSPQDFDSKEIKRSPFYWLGGKIETLAEITKRNDPKEEILRSNMRSNGYDKVVVNTNSWRFTGPLMKGHIMLNFKPKKPKKRKAA